MSEKKKKPKTAAEFLEELKADPDYQRRKREREEARAQRRRFLDEAQAPLVRELRKAGVQVNSVCDLVNRREPYPKAIPVLMEQLEGDYPPEYPARIRECIARALAVWVLESRDWDILLACFRQKPDEQARYALALALLANAREEHRQQLIELVRDPEIGQNRVEFAEALYRFRDEEVDQLLESLVSDPEIGESVERILKTGSAVVD